MVENFLFRSAVKGAALWNAYQRVAGEKSKHKDSPVVFFTYQNKIKAIIK